jgi:hypothetical protein
LFNSIRLWGGAGNNEEAEECTSFLKRTNGYPPQSGVLPSNRSTWHSLVSARRNLTLVRRELSDKVFKRKRVCHREVGRLLAVRWSPAEVDPAPLGADELVVRVNLSLSGTALHPFP